MSAAMRGLTVFIGDIRNCKTKEKEQKRVDKEMAHIRAQFAKKNLDGYNRKKYTWKLVYMYMLGYDIDFGHMESLHMIASDVYTEKNAGYIALTVLLNETDELLRLIVQSIKNDLNSRNELFQCLALSAVANVGGQEFAESLAGDVKKVLINSQGKTFVRKKAALCLLRLFRKYPDSVPVEDDFPPKVIAMLEEGNLGISLSVASLLLGFASYDPTGYEDCVPFSVRLLTELLFTKDRHTDYKYYHTLCPWLQVKLLRLIQFFPPSKDPNVQPRLNDVLHKILTRTEVTKSVNKNNADHAILFEAVNVIIHLCVHGVTDLHGQALGLLGRFISVREPNIRYLGLETMARLARIPGSLDTIKRHQNTIQFSLKDADVSIRKRALDLLFAMCDKTNAAEIVEELLKFLSKSDYNIKEELVIKIAILAEKFAKDLRWYVDIILQLIAMAGDFVSEDIWHRVVQIVTNNDELQEYAASTMLKALQNPGIHENGIKVGGYILGEFGHQIKDENIRGQDLFDLLMTKFAQVSNDTKALLLSAFIKMANTYPDLKDRVNDVFKANAASVDTELQQRSVEYMQMNQPQRDALMSEVFEIMPNFPERQSALENRLNKNRQGTADRDPLMQAKKNEEKEEEEKAEEKSDDEAPENKDDGNQSDREQEDTGDKVVQRDILGAGMFAPEEDDNATNSGPVVPQLFGNQDFKRLAGVFGADKGVIYESQGLLITMKVQAGQGSQAKMILTYSNKTTDNLENLKLEAHNTDGLKLQVRPMESLTVPPEANGQPVNHYLLWHCQEPFADSPTLTLNFDHNSLPETLTIRIPVFLSQFVTPTPFDAATFIENWKNENNQVVRVLQSPDIIELHDLQQQMQKRLNLAIIPGVDKKEENFVCSGTFHAAKSRSSGEEITMPVLMRVETKPQTKFVRVSVRSSDQAVADAAVANLAILVGAAQM